MTTRWHWSSWKRCISREFNWISQHSWKPKLVSRLDRSDCYSPMLVARAVLTPSKLKFSALISLTAWCVGKQSSTNSGDEPICRYNLLSNNTLTQQGITVRYTITSSIPLIPCPFDLCTDIIHSKLQYFNKVNINYSFTTN